MGRRDLARRDRSSFRQDRNDRLEQLCIPPHSVEAEQAVLGGLMLAPETWDRVGNLASADFYRRDHQLIFEAIGELAEKRKPFDAVTLGEWFESQGQAELVANGAYLIELASTTPSAANIEAYAAIVREKAAMRSLIEIGTRIVNDGFSPEGRDSAELRESARSLLDGPQRTDEKAVGVRDVPLQAFMETPPSTIGYAVHPIIPRGVVTLWGGHGGAGKSISALQLMAHGACGAPWQGLTPDGAIRCAYFSLEDPGDLVRYRLRRICESYSLDVRYVEGNVRVFDCPDGKTALMSEVSAFGLRSMVETSLMSQIRRLCEGADLVVIDNASDAYGGNENDRQSVRTFMGALGRIARECDAGVVLLAHIDKSAARNGANGNTYSGSTAWHNSARSRLAIVAGTKPADVELHHEKNNLGKCADPIKLKWNDHGVLVPLSSMDWAEVTRESDDSASAMAVLVAAHKRGIRVPTATQGQHTAPRAVQHLAEFVESFGKQGSRGNRKFNTALDDLCASGRIVKHSEKAANRHPVELWRVADVSALNGALNGAPNASEPASAPPYGNPYGVSHMGGAARSTELSAGEWTQEDGEDES